MVGRFELRFLLMIASSFIAPFVFFFFFYLYNVTSRLMEGYNLHFTTDPALSVLLYMLALLFFVFIGIPISLIIERMNKGTRWINYSLAGIFIGLIISIFNGIEGLDVSLVSYLPWAYAGFSFYIVLVALEKLTLKLRNGE